MNKPIPRTRTVEVTLPDEAFRSHPWRPEALARELRTLWLIERVRDRRLGFGKAAELAGLPQADFIRLLSERGVTIFDLDDDELAEEFGESQLAVAAAKLSSRWIASATPAFRCAGAAERTRGRRLLGARLLSSELVSTLNYLE